MKKLLLLLSATLFTFSAYAESSSPSSALLQQQIQMLQTQMEKLGATVKAQQEIIESMRSQVQENSVAKNISAPSSATEIPALPNANTKNIAPLIDIGVVGDLLGTVSDTIDNDEGNNRFSLRELELVFGHDLDPYARFDVAVAFSDTEDPELEEAYVTYWDLPWESKGRIGRFRPKIGKASAIHRDSLDTVDEPFVVQRYLGAEGLAKTGLDVSGFTPFSSDSFTQQITLGMLEGGVGEGGETLGEARNRPSLYARASHFVDLSDETSFELGGTYLLGSSDDDSKSEVNLFGVDATYVHHFSPINKFKLQSEFFFQDRTERDETSAENPFGFYVLADYRLAERWGVGSRYDWVEPVLIDANQIRNQDQATSTYLTFYQSEFVRWRFQYQYARLLEGQNDNRFFLQGVFALGTHKHALQ